MDELFWITDAVSGNYFHWLTEALPKLHAIHTSFDKFNVLLPTQYENIHFVKQSLQAFPGANILYQPGIKPILTPYLYLISSISHPHIIIGLRSRILDFFQNGEIANGDCKRAEGRVYISRARQNKRRIVNETSLVRSIEPLGYQIAVMEELSFTEQVNLMRNTTMLLSSHGAGLTNMIFMPTGSAVIEIRREADSFNNCFYWLASVLGHRYYYLGAQGLPLKLNKSEYLAEDLVVDVPRLLEVLKTVG